MTERGDELTAGRSLLRAERKRRIKEAYKGFGADINAAEDIGFTAFTQVGCKIYLRQKNRAFVCIADLRSCKYNEQLLKTAKNKIPLVRLFFMSVPKISCGFCGGKNIKTLDG